MKKIIFTLITSALFFSCSTDDSSNEIAPSLDTHLVSRMYFHEFTESHIDFTYNANNQLIEGMTSDGQRQTFDYHSNGLIRENAFYNRDQEWTGSLILEYNTSGNVSKLTFGNNSPVEFNVNYIDNDLVEVLKTNINTNEVIIRFLMEMNSNLDVSNLKSYNQDNELLYNIDFFYDNRKNVNRTVTTEAISGIETVSEFDWGNGLMLLYNQEKVLYERMPNGMSLSDFIDLTDQLSHPQINFHGNGMNPKLNFDNYRLEYTYFSNGLIKIQDFDYNDDRPDFEPNRFTYEYINKN